jgi:hypothetical protein
MGIISYVHKSVALLFQILELVDLWTYRVVFSNIDLCSEL